MTVDTYLNKYTSEDNASFEELVALENRKEEIRNAWMYEAEKKHNEELVTRGQEMIKEADEQLMVAAAPSAQQEKPKELDNWSYKARNSVLFDLDEVSLTPEEILQRKKMNARIINRKGTRLPEKVKAAVAKTPALQALAKQQGKVDITGKEIGVPEVSTAFELVSTPTIIPGVDDSPNLTWGDIDGTPFHLDASNMTASSNAPVFRIPDTPVREKIAQSMAETIAKRYREKRKVAIRQAEKYHAKTPSFGSVRSSEKLFSMSPAARRLMKNSFGIRLNSGEHLGASYAPSPERTPDFILRSRSVSVTKNDSDISDRPATAADSLTSITDNLLSFGDFVDKTKDRPSASDFF